MSVNSPTNTVLLIIVTMLASATLVWFILWQGLKRMSIAQDVRRKWGWAAAVVLSTWLLARLALAAYPPGDAVLATQFLITFASLGYGLVLGVLLLALPMFRQLLRAIPETWLIAPHALRLTGFFFLALMDMGRLPSEFALSAGYGDMTVGLLALGLIYLLAKKKPYASALAVGWNILGLTDFVGALTTGGLYIVPFATQLAAAGVSLDYLNYVLIVPSFGVPLYALLHTYSLFQIFSGRTAERKPNVEERVQAAIFHGEQRSAHRS